MGLTTWWDRPYTGNGTVTFIVKTAESKDIFDSYVWHSTHRCQILQFILGPETYETGWVKI